MAKIGKKELIEKIAKETNLSKKDIQKVIEKEGFNPQTKEKIKIPAYKTIAFKASSKLKETL